MPVPLTFLESTTGVDLRHLARKPNYGFEKRKKEIDRKAKKDAKREERRRREERASEDTGTPRTDEGANPESGTGEPEA